MSALAVFAATVVAALPLAAPPPAAPAVASTLHDALFAIERAAADDPTAAQTARLSYDAAVAAYRAHEYAQARADALLAISQAGAPIAAPVPVPQHHVRAPFPGPRYYVIPAELPATPENAHRYVTLAQRAMAGCPTSTAAAADYRAAVIALRAKNYRAAMAGARNTVDDCTGR